jgi:hypothetical protein
LHGEFGFSKQAGLVIDTASRPSGIHFQGQSDKNIPKYDNSNNHPDVIRQTIYVGFYNRENQPQSA